MPPADLRRPTLEALPERFDLIVIGGGITGAGIAREAVRSGCSVLLVEQGDFASGTSSGSSKLVHGGLRYLKSGQWRLTLESVRERNRLLREEAGLVTRQPFLMPVYRGMKPGRAVMRAGLGVYDLMGGEWRSRSLSAAQTLALEPGIRSEQLDGAVIYDDAQTDDAGLTLKLVFAAARRGATVLNYVAAEKLLRTAERVEGVALHDRIDGHRREIRAQVVVHAAGPWAGEFASARHGAPLLRPLRGSHLVFRHAQLPVARAVSWLHPRDRRPIFVYPWLGATLYGTTDVDHEGPLDEVRLSAMEADYLIEGLRHQFPAIALTLDDAVSSYAAVRPIVAGGKADPSAESRESALWSEPGYVGITGGKLTTFRVTAREVLKVAAAQVPKLGSALADGDEKVATADRLSLRYGTGFSEFQASDRMAGAEQVAGSGYLWSELRWAARHERVVHLDDLLLRRTRLGLLLPEGASELLPRLRELCVVELGWDEARWQQEVQRYRNLWQSRHAPRP